MFHYLDIFLTTGFPYLPVEFASLQHCQTAHSDQLTRFSVLEVKIEKVQRKRCFLERSLVKAYFEVVYNTFSHSQIVDLSIGFKFFDHFHVITRSSDADLEQCREACHC